jgi:hypothetical protein
MHALRTALPLAAVVLAALPAAASAKSNQPFDVGTPAVERTHLRAGERIALGATVRPLGTRAQWHLTVFFLASRDGHFDRGDGVIAKRRISVLGQRPRRMRARPALKPRAGGRWHVVVCVEQRARHGRRCVDTPRTVMVTAARTPRKPKPPRTPAPGQPQAPRFLGVTDIGIDDCDTDTDTVSFDVGWWPAIDDSTDPDDIVYEVFQATKSGGEDFSHPTYVSEPGDLTVTTPLMPAATYYYVVRARDADGKVDNNTIELSGRPCEDDTSSDDTGDE